jgi:hypothetical protein
MIKIGGAALALAALMMCQAGRPIAAQEQPGAGANGPVQMGDGPNGMIKNGRPTTRGWKSLFDGKTLNGWLGEKGYWEVKEGAIVGTSPPGTPHHHYMFSTKDYSDFELHIDIKLVGYNSGVCIRIHPKTYDDVPGYQVDMGDGYWGCLWDEHHRQTKIFDYPKEKADAILHKDEWNHYYVRAVGHHITIFLNGVKTVEGDDPDGYDSGPLGFQLCHGGNEVASFKNIYIKLLKPATSGTAPAMPDKVEP